MTARGRIMARDLVSVPGLLSLARVPLAAAFPFTVTRPGPACAVLAAAACTDVLDGWWARRFGLVTGTGAALDPLTDKVFVLSVGVSLAAARILPVEAVLLLGAREIGEVLLFLRCAAGTASLRRRAGGQSASVAGKVVTVLQFGTVACALFGAPFTGACVGVTALAGTVAAALYWKGAFRPVPAADPGGSVIPGVHGVARTHPEEVA